MAGLVEELMPSLRLQEKLAGWSTFKFLFSELESQILKTPCNLKLMTRLTSLLLFVIYSRAAEKMHRRDLGSRYFFPRLKSNVSNIKIFHH